MKHSTEKQLDIVIQKLAGLLQDQVGRGAPVSSAPSEQRLLRLADSTGHAQLTRRLHQIWTQGWEHRGLAQIMRGCR